MISSAVLSTPFLQATKLFLVAFAFLTMFALMPAPARAAGLTETQIQAVTGLLKAFDVDSETIGNVEAVLMGAETTTQESASNATETEDSDSEIEEADTLREPKKERRFEDLPGASACGFLMHNLKRGIEGDDVKELQEYLRNTGDFSNESTGYFGPKTEEALKRLQARNNVVSSGDADSTGYGALGPKTRNVLMAHCKERLDLRSQKPGVPTTTSAMPAPTCTLTASKTEVASSETVVLTWASTNASYASAIGEKKGPPQGTLEVVPTETTTYVKKVYGPGGVGECTATVNVSGDSTETKQEMVWNTNASLLTANTLMAIGDGIANVVTAYFEFFGIKL